MSQLNRYDYIIIGGGSAGLNAALLAAERGSVLVVDKGRIAGALADRVRASDRITALEYTHAVRICAEDGAVAGVETLDGNTGERREFSSPVVVISTGGAGQLYRYTTSPEAATGDGVALAFLAGAEVMDMEFYQFHPTALRLDGAPAFPLPEAMRGAGAILRNAQGHPFMADYHPMADLAPLDLVSRAIAAEIERADGQPALLDLSHLPADTVAGRFPTSYAECRQYGLDITRQPIPVAPAAHYMIGGVRIDAWGRTNIPGLYAGGEAAVAGAAARGANRPAGNSLPDTSGAFARRLVEATLGNAPEYQATDGGEDDDNLRIGLANRAMVCATVPERGRENLQDLMWRNVGITRNGTRLLLSARILNLWQRTMAQPETAEDYALRNMLVVARLMVEAALQRRESRGGALPGGFPPAGRRMATAHRAEPSGG